MGYDCRWCCIRASDVGAPHHRDRWWLRAVRNAEHTRRHATEISGSVASGSDSDETGTKPTSESKGSGDAAVLADTSGKFSNGSSDNAGISMEYKQVFESGNDGWQDGFFCAMCGWRFESGRITKFGCPNCGKTQPEILAHTVSNGRERIAHTVSNGATSSGECAGSETTGGIDQARGYWEVESGVGRVVDGVAGRVHRLKALGNGQVPLQAATAWRLLGGA